MKTILILGSGFVSKPVVQKLKKKYSLILVDMFQKNIDKTLEQITKKENIITGIGNTEGGFNIKGIITNLDEIIKKSDLVISLLPPFMHVEIATKCVEQKKHFVSASYTSLEMKKLDEKAKEKNIILLNECGLDPGLDYLSAMKIINEIKEKGGEITSFCSYCGGLPVHQNCNPFHYKFSWSPIGVLRASKASAIFKENNKGKKIASGELFKNYFPLQVRGKEYEAYYNRNSVAYIKTFGLTKAKTFIRGTIRYPGWCDTIKAILDLGLLEENTITCKTYKELIGKKIKSTITKKTIAKYLGIKEEDTILDKLIWLGLFSEEKIKGTTNIESLKELMIKKMSYSNEEKDLVVMQHEIKYVIDDKEKKMISSLIIEGSKESAMSRTVGLPVAYAAELILEGKIKERGASIPISKEFYEPILKKLEEEGIVFEEKWV